MSDANLDEELVLLKEKKHQLEAELAVLEAEIRKKSEEIWNRNNTVLQEQLVLLNRYDLGRVSELPKKVPPEQLRRGGA